jgi:hypothetical protein
MRSKNKWITLSTLLFLASIVGLTGCFKDKFAIDDLDAGTWNPALATPLAKSELTISDVLKNHTSDLFYERSDGLIVLVYPGFMESFSVEEIVNLINQFIYRQFSFANNVATSNLPVSQSYSVPFNTDGNEDFTRIDFGSGKLRIKVEGQGFSTNSMTLTIPGLIDSTGQPFSAPIYNGSSETYDLEGFSFDLTASGSTTNTLVFEFNGSINTTGGGGTGNINFRLEFVELKFHVAFGNFGKKKVALDSDSIEIFLFKNSRERGFFELTDPYFNIDVTNSIGMPIEIELTELLSRNIITNETFEILNTQNDGLFRIQSPRSPFDSTKYSARFDNRNSRIVDVVSPTPQFLSTGVEGRGNAAGHSSTENFITHKSGMSFRTELVMPLEGRAKNIVLRQETPYELDFNPTEIESIKLRINTENGFPFEVTYGIEVLDAGLNVLGTLVERGEIFLRPGVTNSAGRVTADTQHQTDIDISKADMNILERGKYFRIRAEGNTSENGEKIIKIYGDNGLGIQLGLLVNANIDL